MSGRSLYFGAQATELAGSAAVEEGIIDVLTGMFANPFETLASMSFLPIIVFAMLFGIAMLEERENLNETIGLIKRVSNGITNVMFKIIEWVLQYAQIGIFALTVVNFSSMGRT